MHPVENHMPSKTGEFDESVIIDRDEYSFILPAMADLKATRRDEELLFHGPTLQSAFRRAAIELDLMKIGIKNVYQLRHGGASHEAMAQLRDGEGIRDKGQWKSKASVRRYRKGGRVAEVTSRMTSQQQKCGEKILGCLSSILTGSLPPLPDPGKAGSPSKCSRAQGASAKCGAKRKASSTSRLSR